MAKTNKTQLLEVDLDNEDFQLTLMDGSKWLVNPGDLPTVATWLPTTAVRLNEVGDSMFNYEILDITSGVTIRAMRFEQAKGKYP